MSSNVFTNRRDSNTTTIRVNLPYHEYQILQECYKQAGSPEPDNRLSHNTTFKDWIRHSVLHGEVDPSSFDVESIDWESESYWPGDVVFTPEEVSRLKGVTPEVERFKSNGDLAQSFREVLAEFLEGVSYDG